MEQQEQNMFNGLNLAANYIHGMNKEKGFWDKERNIGEMLMLVTSELGEAMEAHRKGRMSNHVEFSQQENQMTFNQNFSANIKDTFEDEIADAIIRLLDLSAGLNIDIEKQINLKLAFNKNREKLHGKLY